MKKKVNKGRDQFFWNETESKGVQSMITTLIVTSEGTCRPHGAHLATGFTTTRGNHHHNDSETRSLAAKLLNLNLNLQPKDSREGHFYFSFLLQNLPLGTDSSTTPISSSSPTSSTIFLFSFLPIYYTSGVVFFSTTHDHDPDENSFLSFYLLFSRCELKK